MFTCSSAHLTLFLRSSVDSPQTFACQLRTSQGVLTHSSLGSWKHTPIISRVLFGDFLTSKPATVAVPSVGRITVVSISMVVVLPAPLGPRSPKISPSSMVRFRWSTAGSFPKVLVRFSVLIIGVFDTGAAPDWKEPHEVMRS